jgi:hypothetical protein
MGTPRLILTFSSNTFMADDAATKNCPKCGESILSNAQKCKHCGSDTRNWFAKHKIITGILALFLLGMVMNAISPSSPSSSNSDSPAAAERQPDARVTATALYAAYEANGIAADAAYKDKIVEVSGTVGNVDKDILDSMYVTLKTGNIIGSVQCMLEDSELNTAMSLSEGNQITVVGRVSGKLGNVLLRECVIK